MDTILWYLSIIGEPIGLKHFSLLSIFNEKVKYWLHHTSSCSQNSCTHLILLQGRHYINVGINVPVSWTLTKNISKNQNLYPQQSQITYCSLRWDTLYLRVLFFPFLMLTFFFFYSWWYSTIAPNSRARITTNIGKNSNENTRPILAGF